MGFPNRPASSGKSAAAHFLLLAAAVAVAAVPSRFGVSHDYAYLQAALLSGAPGRRYHTLGTRLAAHARQQHGVLTVVPTAGSIENIRRLTEAEQRSAPAFALVQDGIPVPADAGLEMLGRLPEAESLPLLSAEISGVLEGYEKPCKTAQALALPARIVLGCASGLSNKAVAGRERVTAQTVGKPTRVGSPLDAASQSSLQGTVPR